MSAIFSTHIIFATIAQLVECYLGKVEVTGSIPVSSSKKYSNIDISVHSLYYEVISKGENLKY